IDIVKEELSRRISLGETHKNITTWANLLEGWLKEAHPYAHNLTAKTIRNNPEMGAKIKTALSLHDPEKIPK
ncbi:hypothetical protein, partial [Methylobacterium sp. WL7]|uniref:hypothetical protein n=1 Tax=Methylobacterium sp. WL7 TaxID=2603900 RepID=UPI001AEDE7EA